MVNSPKLCSVSSAPEEQFRRTGIAARFDLGLALANDTLCLEAAPCVAIKLALVSFNFNPSPNALIATGKSSGVAPGGELLKDLSDFSSCSLEGAVKFY